MRRVEERFETGLLCKSDMFLADSKGYALKRLKYTKRKMDRNKDFAQTYCNRIKEYIDKYLKSKQKQLFRKTWYLRRLDV